MNRLKWKKTSPFHYLCGAITVLGGYFIGWWVAPLGFFSFLGIEIWNKKEWRTSQEDFWEYVAGIFITLAVLLVILWR